MHNYTAGRKNVYDMIGIKHETGEAGCLAIECPLKICHTIADKFLDNKD